jgi:nitric oxide synthase oxygenase domain/subunit
MDNMGRARVRIRVTAGSYSRDQVGCVFPGRGVWGTNVAFGEGKRQVGETHWGTMLMIDRPHMNYKGDVQTAIRSCVRGCAGNSLAAFSYRCVWPMGHVRAW